MPKRQIQENRRMFPYLFIHRVVSSIVHCPHGFPAMDRFLEGSRSASKSASAPRSLPSCHPSHPAKGSRGFLLETLPAVLHRNFQKRPVHKAGTVFPRWHRNAYLSPLPSIAGEGREGREGRCQTEISKKKKIKEFPQTRRSIRIQAATDFSLLSVFTKVRHGPSGD